MHRAGGILLHVSSLPGGHGIGDIGPAAFKWIDFLAAGRQQLWQILPLNPPGYGNSPYASPSSFASNPMLISLDRLVEDELLPKEALGGASWDERRVNFERVKSYKGERLKQAYSNFTARGKNADYDQFVERNRWVVAYSHFMSQRENCDAGYVTFCQFVFDRQWTSLKAYANERGIRIIGDLPMYVSSDSIDCLENPELFDRDSGYVAGAPPCSVHPTGQRWGNPLYRWDRHRAQGFKWWIDRCKAALKRVDVLRLDYFCGYHTCWAVNGYNGHWREGPRQDLFNTVKRELGEVKFIAEDLGHLTPEIHRLRDRFAIMSTRVLHYGFDGLPDNPYLPENIKTNNAVVYTGTHDNNTTRGWYESTPDYVRDNLRKHGITSSDVAWDLIKVAGRSRADWMIIPFQDVLCLGPEARLNTPGTVSNNNWSWRVPESQIVSRVSGALEWLVKTTGRAPEALPSTLPKPLKDAS